jgi:hypothetical protein
MNLKSDAEDSQALVAHTNNPSLNVSRLKNNNKISEHSGRRIKFKQWFSALTIH